LITVNIYIPGHSVFVIGPTGPGPTEIMLSGLTLIDNPIGPFIYSTYLTSIWIWLYVLSGVFIRLLRKFSGSLEIARNLLNIEEKPLQSIGFVSMLIVSVVYLIIPFLVDS